MTAAVLKTPVADLGDSVKVLTMGNMPPQLMRGLGYNGVEPQEIAMDANTIAPTAPSVPKDDFMASFKPPALGG
jgi:hypothetical protein